MLRGSLGIAKPTMRPLESSEENLVSRTRSHIYPVVFAHMKVANLN